VVSLALASGRNCTPARGKEMSGWAYWDGPQVKGEPKKKATQKQLVKGNFSRLFLKGRHWVFGYSLYFALPPRREMQLAKISIYGCVRVPAYIYVCVFVRVARLSFIII